jgi:hypothetical protein
MKVQTFKAFGGPLDGLVVTEQYAGPDYIRFNSSAGVLYPFYKLGTHYISTKGAKRRGNVTVPYCPRCVLVYLPEPPPVEIT